MIMQMRQCTDPSLCWSFYDLWENIVVAIIAGELRGLAIMTISNKWMRGVFSSLAPYRSLLISCLPSPSPADPLAHFLRSFPEPFSLSIPESVSLSFLSLSSQGPPLQLSGYLLAAVLGFGQFTRQAHHLVQEYFASDSYSTSLANPRMLPGPCSPARPLQTTDAPKQEA